MNLLQKWGGAAALVNALAYVVGIAFALTLLAPILEASPAEHVAFLVENQALMVSWHTLIYLVAGFFMVPLVLALYDRTRQGAPVLSQVAAAIGLIWATLIIASGLLLVNDTGVIAEIYGRNPAEATTVWLALSAVENGLGGAIELPGGVWILLVSIAALRTRTLPTALNIIGMVIGVAGIVTVVPPLYEAGTVFGLGFILWFVWAGVALLRGGPSAETTTADFALIQ